MAQFHELSKEERRNWALKIMSMLASLDYAADVAEDLSFFPDIHKFMMKRTSENYRSEVSKLMKKILFDMQGEHILNEKGERITQIDDIQLEFFEISRMMVKFTKEGIAKLSEELNRPEIEAE